MTVVHSDMHARVSSSFIEVDCWFRFAFSLDLGLLFECFCHFVSVLFVFVLLGLVSSRDWLVRTSPK